MYSAWPRMLFLLLSFSGCYGALVNRTIDDTFGDRTNVSRVPVYSPSDGIWKDASCTSCLIQPDKERAYNGTWTAASYIPGNSTTNIRIDLQFTGAAIWVYLIVARAQRTACTFSLDEKNEMFIRESEPSSPAIDYGVLAFYWNGRHGVHNLTITTGELEANGSETYLNLDYAIYSIDAPDGGSNRNTTIIGATMGSVLLALFLLLMWFTHERSKRRARKVASTEVDATEAEAGEQQMGELDPQIPQTPSTSHQRPQAPHSKARRSRPTTGSSSRSSIPNPSNPPQPCNDLTSYPAKRSDVRSMSQEGSRRGSQRNKRGRHRSPGPGQRGETLDSTSMNRNRGSLTADEPPAPSAPHFPEPAIVEVDRKSD